MRAPAFAMCLCLVACLAACSSTSAGDAGAGGDGAAAGAGVDVVAAEDAPAEDAREWTTLDAGGGRYVVAFAPVVGPIPRNQSFELDVQLLRAGEPATDCRLVVRADMPAHGHGLVRAPRVIDQGGGRYRVESLLMHMRGHWVIFFDITDAAGVETLSFELDL